MFFTFLQNQNLNFLKYSLKNKNITSEVCIHHLSFNDLDYKEKGAFIKWNPAVKSELDQDALWEALNSDRIDIVATDHAPHTLEEKQNNYLNCPSGGPLVQHSLIVMFEHYLNKKITLQKIVEKMCNNPANIFNVNKRGYIKEGYFADLVILDPKKNKQLALIIFYINADGPHLREKLLILLSLILLLMDTLHIIMEILTIQN